jgi:hypothetical protein
MKASWQSCPALALRVTTLLAGFRRYMQMLNSMSAQGRAGERDVPCWLE